MPPDQRVAILIVLRDPPTEPTQLAMFPLYPSLGLVGQIALSAGDGELDKALKKLVSDALAPLKRLDEKTGSSHPADQP